MDKTKQSVVTIFVETDDCNIICEQVRILSWLQKLKK
jgi:hypothetical protein